MSVVESRKQRAGSDVGVHPSQRWVRIGWRRLLLCQCWLLLAGCGWGVPERTPLPPTPVLTQLDVVIHDSYYGEQDDNIARPPVWETTAGGDVILNIENRGKLAHNWAIIKPGVAPPVPYTGGQDDALVWYGAGMVYSANKTTVTFVAPPDPGEYLVMCTVENHYPLMQGRLVVK